jgi:quinoprotein dehydrogenase-associated probable ABC transporter substrate-binding protein
MRSIIGTRHSALGVLFAVAGVVALGAAPRPSAEQRVPSAAFRICSDPNNLPLSNRRREGYENKIAERLARDLGETVQYTWRPMRRGYVRTTLNANACDILMGVPAGYDPVRTTRPYYRSTYVWVTRRDRHLHIRSMDDTLLKHLKIGVQLIGDDYVNTPPVQALTSRGMVDNVIGYMLYGDYSKPNPPAAILDSVAAGKIDVAVVWGPLAGYFANRMRVPLVYTPVTPAVDSASGQIFAFDIAIGVRHRDSVRARQLDSLLVRDAPAIRAILQHYHVPLVPDSDGATARVNGDENATHD